MRKLIELSNEEIKSLVEENEKLNDIIYYEAMESEKFWIEEELHHLKGAISDYRIETYGKNYVQIEDHADLLQGYNMIEETFSGSKEFIDQLELCERIRYDEDKQDQFEHEVEKLHAMKVSEYDKRMKYDPDNNELYDFILSNDDLFKNLYVDNMGNIFKMVAA